MLCFISFNVVISLYSFQGISNPSCVSPLTPWFCRLILFNFYTCVGFHNLFLLLITNFMMLLLRNMLCMISAFSVFWNSFYSPAYGHPGKQSMCTWENTSSSVALCNVLWMSVRSRWLILLYKSSHLVVPSIISFRVLKLPIFCTKLCGSPYSYSPCVGELWY